MGNLFTLKFWFDARPAPMSNLNFKIFTVFVLLLLILTVVSVIIRNRQGKNLYNSFWRKFSSFLFTNTIVGVFLLFFNFEYTPFLSSRFWLAIWFVEMAIWIYFIVKDLSKIPERKKELEKTKEFKKYIP